MQLGFVSAILPDLSFEDVLKTAADIGYDCVEVMCWPVGKATRRYAGVTHIDVTDFDDAAAAKVHELTAKYGVSVSALGYYPNALTPDQDEAETSVEHIRKVIAAAGKLGVNRMTTFIGRDWTKSVDDNFPKFEATWKPLIAFAEEAGVKVGIENCPMIFGTDEWPGGKNLMHSPAIFRRMFEAIPSDHFGLNYDPSHPVWLQMDYLKPMREFAHKLFHMHAKDVRVDQHLLDDLGILAHPNDYHSPKLPGMGDVDWGKFFSVLTDTGYNGPICVEVEDRSYEDSLENRKRALIQSHTYLRNFVPKS
ncbi:sugar phosphate isomerase/epimerase family protein [Fuerstiella marisgermanici]|uniref:Putative L-xylulose 5-phosphate 3-epimerase n=1 Tax=Fuerstiella marisgermanici TaxID=1891926 RepID=A0A1P8W9Y8_9PLAN|nr:sugar phosphate isomerase/epimerase family protein [Fuerstiella marisgermanici]APZ90861.1 putative L-xylulose 5-phosphate 3-epimerase [Fuerstiella marisgermanici]